MRGSQSRPRGSRYRHHVGGSRSSHCSFTKRWSAHGFNRKSSRTISILSLTQNRFNGISLRKILLPHLTKQREKSAPSAVVMDGRRAHRRPYREQLEKAPGILVLVILPRSTHLVPPLDRSVFSGLRQADRTFRGSYKKCEGGQSKQIVRGQRLAPGDVPRGHRLDLGDRANRIAAPISGSALGCVSSSPDPAKWRTVPR
jgi:hypothetical protein